MKLKVSLVFLLFGIIGFNSNNLVGQTINKIFVPAAGNSWVINNLKQNEKMIGKGGIRNWTNPESLIRIYFKTGQAGNLNIEIIAKSVSEKSKIKVTGGNRSQIVEVANVNTDTIPIGNFPIGKAGYHFLELQGIEKTGEYFPEIDGFLINGEVTSGKIWFVHDDFYWGRRGPSVHLNYQIPLNAGDVEYFYNEITVPEGNDVLGSYFMADGFAQGYFGMQVNSESERRVLFSVWSPFKTDNPKEIPENQKIKLLKKGDDVHAEEFGDEGSGGQSYLKYMWKAGITYKFLLKGKPTGNGETDFTAWFFAPEVGEWKLIASFRRPETNTYLSRLHSFLENFYTETGFITRKGLYSNQWVCSTNGQWREITKARFTADATARKESRMDYAGGAEEKSFFLQNCGFFDETTSIDSYFIRKPLGIPPVINFEDLP